MAEKVIFAMYDDDDKLMDGAKHLVANDVKVSDVYSPMPLHGIDSIIGIEPTRLAITAFMYGITGLGVAIWMTNYMMIQDWPQDIGGKPSFSYLENMPAFVPVMFELTVFFAAHLMVITFYMRSKLWPFKKAENPDVRTTDDHFLMEIDGSKETDIISDFLKSTGAVEVKIIEKNEDH